MDTVDEVTDEIAQLTRTAMVTAVERKHRRWWVDENVAALIRCLRDDGVFAPPRRP
jgi:hypothetical protein